MSEGINEIAQPKTPQENQETQPEAIESREPNAADTSEEGRTPESQREQPPSADESRQNFERIKAQDAEPEKKEGGYRSLIKDIDDRERHLTASVGGEQEKTSAARARLGLGSESTDTHAVRAATKELSDLKDLRGELVTKLYKGKETQESQERDRALREGTHEVGEAVTQLTSELQRRDDGDMDTFMDARALSSIRSGASVLQRFAEGREKIDSNELALEISHLNSGIVQMERTRRNGPEDAQSLRRVGFAFQSLDEAARKLGRSFVEGDEQAAFATRRLIQTVEQKRVGIQRLWAAFTRL